jgi:hypothetical protein
MRRHVRTGWFTSLAAAVLLAAGLGLAADQAFAAKGKAKGGQKVKAHIKHGTLVVEGTRGDDQIVLRLRSGDPTTVEVVTQDGVVGHNLRRDRFDQTSSTQAKANDRVAVDESNGVFTNTETTTVDATRQRHAARRSGHRPTVWRLGQRRHRRQPGQRHRFARYGR